MSIASAALWLGVPGVAAALGAVYLGIPVYRVRWAVPVNERQKANAAAIVRGFRAAGLPDAAALAAVANAWWESGTPHPKDGARGLNELAVGDGGRSHGLYQMHDAGAGRGLTIRERQDPERATAEMLGREVLAPAGARFRRAARMGASVATLAEIFGEDIERPAAVLWGAAGRGSPVDPDARRRELNHRSETARRLFGSAADRPGVLVRWVEEVGP